MHALLQTAVFITMLGQPDPGTIAVQGGDLAIVTFSMPPGTQYQLDYPIGQSLAWFDAARTNLAYPFQTYTARSKGDLNGDGLLDGRDVQAFVAHLISGPYDARADFNDDSVLDSSDVPGMVEALLGGYPANGVVLHVEADSASSALGDAPINLLTLNNGNWVVTQTRPMTLVEFQVPTSGIIGAEATFTISPAIAPIAFDSATTAVWEGEVLVNNGAGPIVTVRFGAAQVRESSSDTAAVLVGDGTISQGLPNDVIVNNTGVTHGRMTFKLNGLAIKTQPFDFDHVVPEQFDLLSVAYDAHDPLGVQSDFGGPADFDVVHIGEPSDPQLDLLFFFHRILEIKIAENASTATSSPASFTVKLMLLDDLGNVIQAIPNVTMTKYANDGDPNTISYRSSLARPFILIDTPINGAAFPNFSMITIPAAGGRLAVLKT